MTRRTWALAALAWVAVVIAGSTVTWFAIDRAGQQVSDPDSIEQVTSVGTVGTPPLPSATPSPTSSATAPSATAPTVTATPRPTSGPSSAASRSPAVRTEIRTWSSTPGTVTVACTGRIATNKGALPKDGWHVEQSDDPGDDIEVKFERSETEIKVRATCVGGVPQFRVESGDDH